MDKDLVGEIVGALVGEGHRIETLAEDDPLRKKGAPLGDTFTEGVGFLRSVFPNEAIRRLMVLVWDLVGHRITPVALGPNVKSLSIAVMGSTDLPRVAIFMPHDWLEQVRQDPIYQMGALVFVGSQAVDFYNRKMFTDQPGTLRRARAYEAEYLLTLKKASSTLRLNDYQKGLLAQFPQGLATDSVADLLYTSKAFVPPA